MVRLNNIKKNGNIIQCDIFPEDSNIPGYIVVNINTETVREYELPKGYEWCNNHMNHAMRTLIEISNEKELPKERLVMWY